MEIGQTACWKKKSTLNFLSFDSEVPTSRQRYRYPPNGKKKVRVPEYGENYVKSSYAPTKEALQKRHKYPMVDTKKKQGNEKKKLVRMSAQGPSLLSLGPNQFPGLTTLQNQGLLDVAPGGDE